MEALSVTKRYQRFNETNDYQQTNKQTKQKSSKPILDSKTNNNNSSSNNNNNNNHKRLLNRPLTSSHALAQQQQQQQQSSSQQSRINNSKLNPNTLYNKLLMNHKNTESHKYGLPHVNTNLNDLSIAKNSSQTLMNNFSNQSSPINSDIFVDRLSDQRIFNRQFKINQISDNNIPSTTNNHIMTTSIIKSRILSANKILNISKPTKHLTFNLYSTNLKSKTPINNSNINNNSNNQKIIKSAKSTRDEMSNYLAVSRNSANRKSNLSNLSHNTKTSNDNNYQHSSIYFDNQQLIHRKLNTNSASTNYFPIDSSNQKLNQTSINNNNINNINNNTNNTNRFIRNSASNKQNIRSSKYPRFNLYHKSNNQNPPSVFNLLSSNLKSRKNTVPINNYFNDVNNINLTKSTENLNNNILNNNSENLLVSTSANVLELDENKMIINRADNKIKNNYESNENEQNMLPTDSPGIVNLLLNNHNKLYESTKNIVKTANKYQTNRVPVKFSNDLENNVNAKIDNEENKNLYDENIEIIDDNGNYDEEEAMMLAACNKKCNEWLDKHVMPYFELFSNTSSPTLNESEM